MYVEPWIVWLILGPIALVMALTAGYLVLLLLGMLSLTIDLCLSGAADWLTVSLARAATWGLRYAGPLVQPFKHHGPWLDYVVMAGLLLVLSIGSVLWLAA
jgi:hypothetical protein